MQLARLLWLPLVKDGSGLQSGAVGGARLGLNGAGAQGGDEANRSVKVCPA